MSNTGLNVMIGVLSVLLVGLIVAAWYFRPRGGASPQRPRQLQQQHMQQQQPHVPTGMSPYHGSKPPASWGGPSAKPLPPGWFAHRDPASGDEYFYHEATGETTWERPGA